MMGENIKVVNYFKTEFTSNVVDMLESSRTEIGNHYSLLVKCLDLLSIHKIWLKEKSGCYWSWGIRWWVKKKNLKSLTWQHHKRKRIQGKMKAISNYCEKKLLGENRVELNIFMIIWKDVMYGRKLGDILQSHCKCFLNLAK